MAEQIIVKSKQGNVQLDLGKTYKSPVWDALKQNEISFDFFVIWSVSKDEFEYVLNDKHYLGLYQPAYDCTVIFYMPSEAEIDAGKVMVPVGFSYGNCQTLIEYNWEPESFRELLTVVTFADNDMVGAVQDIIYEVQEDGGYNFDSILNCF